ncbi:MAG: tetratricopeptide repeat protein, partial [Acidobacteriota bacterium]
QEGKTEPVTGLAPDLTELINRLKAPAPGARPSARDAAAQLRAIEQAPVRRRLARLRLGAVAALALVAVIMTFQALRIRQESERAQEAARLASLEAETTQQVLDYLVSIFETADPWRSAKTVENRDELTVREVLDQSLDRLDELRDQPVIQARLLTQVGIIRKSLWQLDDALPLFESSLEIRKEAEAGDLEIAESLIELGNTLQLQGDYEQGADYIRQSLELREKAGASPQELGHSLHFLGSIYSQTGRVEEAQELLERSIAVRTEAFGADSLELATSLSALGSLDGQQGRFELSEQRLARAVEIFESQLGADHPRVARTLKVLGITYDQTRQIDRALETYRRALAIMEPNLPPEDPEIAVTRMNLGISLNRSGDVEGAQKAYLEALASLRKSLGESHPRVGEALGNLGVMSLDNSRFREARGYLSEAKDVFETSFGAEHPSVAMSWGALAQANLRLRDFEAARQGFAQAIDIFAKTLGPEHLEVARSSGRLSQTLRRLGEIEAAREAIDRALTLGTAAFPENHPGLAILHMEAAAVARSEARLGPAADHLDTAEAMLATDPDNAGLPEQRATVLRERALLALERGDVAASLTLFDQATESLAAKFEEDQFYWIGHWTEHARALREAGKTPESRTLERKARDLATSLGISLEGLGT